MYRVWDSKQPEWCFYIKAPSKRIARWIGCNIIKHNYRGNIILKEVIAIKERKI
jgi:hypothetical protein